MFPNLFPTNFICNEEIKKEHIQVTLFEAVSIKPVCIKLAILTAQISTIQHNEGNVSLLAHLTIRVSDFLSFLQINIQIMTPMKMRKQTPENLPQT